jgi:hypothetical protein
VGASVVLRLIVEQEPEHLPSERISSGAKIAFGELKSHMSLDSSAKRRVAPGSISTEKIDDFELATPSLMIV